MSNATETNKLLFRLRKLRDNIPNAIFAAQHEAILRAVEVATENTPPKENGGFHGTNTVTGEMKRAWARDSKTEPRRNGYKFTVELRNDMEYASYVNDGHRMDKHFVPGLYIDPNTGQLNRNTDPNMDTGIVVGTKTSYVRGRYMADKARDAYEATLLLALEKRVKEAAK